MKFEPGTKLGPYQILGELGRGGMATVYRAYQPSLEREVAIKILPEFLVEQPGFKARFHREAVAVARLQHPNILSVYDHGEQDGVTYIVSEYVEGGTLASRMGAPIQLDYCVRILRPIADALDYAHSEGVIHRDVKPSNVLLDRRGVPILSDFGLARVAEGETERLTQTGAMVGTPTYMAPEQCSGGDVGAPADIYALAVIAFEMVTGRVPFSGTNPLSIIAAHQTTPPPLPRKFNPSLPASIEQPLLAGLAKDPAQRPETASDFVEALAAAIPGPASQYPLTPPPATPLPATPTAIAPPPAPSYPATALPVATPPSNPPSPPQYAPPTPAPPAYSPPPYAPAAQPQPYVPAQAPSYPVVAPYSTAQATPPPSYPAVAVQQPSYPPTPAYPVAPQWTGPQPARREGIAGWVIVALGVGGGLAAIVAFAAIVAPLAPDLDGTARTTWLILGSGAAVAIGLCGAALLGLRARDGWAPAVGWGAVAALAVTVIGVPVAAAVGWGIAQSPRSTVVAPQSRPGGGMRAGAPLVAGAVVLLLVLGAGIFGFGQQTSNGPSAQATPTPTACNILKAGTPISAGAVGLDCGFTVASTQSQVDCRSVTALPGPLQHLSYDDNTNQAGGGATFGMDGAGCHLDSPAKNIESDIASTSALAPGPTLMVSDFLVPQSASVIGFLFGCDSSDQLAKCIEVDLETDTSSIYVWDDDNRLIGQSVSTVSGPNRLMAVFEGEQIRVWFNGQLVATETAKRAHGAGRYLLLAANVDDKSSLEAIVHQFAVYSLKQ